MSAAGSGGSAGGGAVSDGMWRGEVTAELRHIHATLRELQHDVHDLRSYVAGELSAHAAYHAAHESRWGPVRWCEQHPFRLALLVLAACTLAAMHQAQVDWREVAMLVRGLLKV